MNQYVTTSIIDPPKTTTTTTTTTTTQSTTTESTTETTSTESTTDPSPKFEENILDEMTDEEIAALVEKLQELDLDENNDVF